MLQKNINYSLFSPFKEVSGVDTSSTDGLHIVPRPKDMPRYDYAAAKQYCESRGKALKDLTQDEWSMFQV